jgi:hypothetical protein
VVSLLVEVNRPDISSLSFTVNDHGFDVFSTKILKVIRNQPNKVDDKDLHYLLIMLLDKPLY